MEFYLRTSVAHVVADNSELSTIQAEDFAEHVVLMKDEGNAIITEEFESISVDAPFTHHAGKIVCNKAKNRYKNILPCKIHIDGYSYT